ncbi:MAG: hypothetical protein HC852_12535 [Acaryochloridaceae cyanobacterium RU_4_10]|nr:hypothetical protein [Acaryochloridaceae cyanobacterium RU_4_10]
MSVITSQNSNKLLRIIREMVVSWNITETGAPTIDSEIPIGYGNFLDNLIRITGITDKDLAISLFQETNQFLEKYLQVADLQAGRYSYPNHLYGKGNNITIDILLDIDPSQAKNQVITFDFTEQHKMLLQAASIRWHEWDKEDEGLYPTPGIDPKRPYGDRTYYELDMADALRMDYSEKLDPYFQKLHFEMQSALQVFLRYASLPVDSH